MNSENSKTPKQNVFVLKLTDKIDLRNAEKVIALSNYQKADTIIINLKYLHLHGMINSNYLMDLILYQIFRIIFNIF